MSDGDRLSIANSNELVSFIGEKLNKSNAQSSIKYVEKLLNEQDFDDSGKISSFIEWAKNRGKQLKVSENIVPLSSLQNATLYDIRVQSRGPDDIVYDRDAAIRAKIARGNSVLEYKVGGNNGREYDLIIYALRKFTGGLGDEDDVDRNNKDWKKYFLKDLDETRRVVALQKANGEAAHMSARFIDGQFFICAGSKNVHLLFQKKSDIEKYAEERFTVARIIAEAISKYLNDMDSELKKMFLSFLSLTKLTVIFEILNPNTQHVEDLSYLKEPLVKFITFCSNKLIEKPTNLCVIPPDSSIEIAKIFGLSCVNYENFLPNQVDDFLVKARKDHGHEGYVLYFLDSDENVIGLLKKKSVWYIILRAIREKLRFFISKRSTQTLDDIEKKVNSRLQSIQKWIGFSDEDLKKWQDLATKFVRWFENGYKTNKISQEDFSLRYPVLWNTFLKERDLSDKFDITIEKQSISSLADIEVDADVDNLIDDINENL